ncbi:MAG: hypothetical protein ABW189_03430 [Rickettsiales bacterium]
MKTLAWTLVASLFATSCAGGRSLSLGRPFALDPTPPPGSPPFRQAYKDGCESALSGMGNPFIKMFHHFSYDTRMANDQTYNRTWNASNDYCRLFLFTGDEHLQNEEFQRYDKPFWFME